MNGEPPLTDDQPAAGLDMDPEVFRRHGHEVIDWIADYLAGVGSMPVLPSVLPGEVRAALPAQPPRAPEPMDAILADFQRVIVPATTHWNHPGFLAYFGITGSGPGILGEALAAALNVNAMLWRSGPAQTELEELTLDWLRQMLDLPPGFEGVINDTASTSTFYALAAARESLPGLAIRQEGLSGRPEVPRLRVYCSREAHSSVDKAVAALGLGLDGVAHIDTDAELRMDPGALRSSMEADRQRGVQPLAVVATVGTTSTTAVDPVPAIADVCGEQGVWLHVDAAYGGTAAIAPSMRWVLDGCERADSLVVNPHKWLFVPLDCSVLYTRRPDALAAAFSLEPEYLRTPDAARARSLMDYGLALGRRFRSLKLWFVIRYFGVDGIIVRLEEHMRLAQLFAGWIDAHPDFQRLAPTRFSVVVFRHRPGGMPEAEVDTHNEALIEHLNATGEVFLSHTRVGGAFAIRLAIGNLRTTQERVTRAWELLQSAADEVA